MKTIKRAAALGLMFCLFGWGVVSIFQPQSITRENIEIATLGLRLNNHWLIQLSKSPSFKAPTRPDEKLDVTLYALDVITTAAVRPPDRRFEESMKPLRIDDGFPKSRPPKLFYGANVRVKLLVGQDGKLYVHYQGLATELCKDVEFATCDPSPAETTP